MSEVMASGQMGSVELPKHLEYINDIHYSGQYLLDLINDILDLSKIEASQATVNESVFDIADSIEDAIRLSDVSGRQHVPTVTFEKPDTTIYVQADKRLITQITVNLLSNSLKFTPEDGTVTTSAFIDDDGECHIVVADTGCGIGKNELERVMEPFAQGNDPYLRNSNGTGLGLSLVKAMVELHDGDVLLTSVSGEGTRVEISLPAARVMDKLD